uniref:Zinc finger CCHC domain-containing protein 8 n=1 Tax=Esox lucius TaxID=8010 RepID=A0AAY5L9J2_ESOLU
MVWGTVIFISRQCRQEIEDSICSIVHKHQLYGGVETGTPSSSVNPQTSSFVMEEDKKTKATCGITKIKEAFSMVGSVLYFTSFCLDKLGQPLLNDNPQQTEGWQVPKYQQVFSQVLALNGQEVQIKEKRAKPCCFNCGLDGHQLRDCPQPKDNARINEKRKEFSQGNQGNLSNQRYHAEEVEERFAKYKPGIMSEELLSALGVDMNTLPPHIYRMRELGYPPGWLKEAEMENSGLTLYDGKEQTEDGNGQKISYDVSKLIDFPGFNISAPSSVKDVISLSAETNRDMFESLLYVASLLWQWITLQSVSPDQDTTSRHHRSSDSFQFQPPLPPGSPSFGSPPPLPHGTPPATPTPPPLPKGTPPPTPTNGSPALRGRTVSEESAGGGGEEEELTLDELEEQQRLILAALENADTATSSDSEAPAVGTPFLSSPSISTQSPDEEESPQSPDAADRGHTVAEKPVEPKTPVQEEISMSHQAAAGGASEVASSPSLPQTPVQQKSCQTDSSDQDATEDLSDSAGKVTAVPHRSRFAQGIIPFEDTPEFTEVAEATGTYLKIRDLLKGSPRNVAKNKK